MALSNPTNLPNIPYSDQWLNQLVGTDAGGNPALKVLLDGETFSGSIGTFPFYTSSVFDNVVTSGGAGFVNLNSNLCNSLQLENWNSYDVEVSKGGAGVYIRVPANSTRIFSGITNANQLGVRRVDLGAAITLQYECITL